jgi:hypothetical protein
MAFRSAIETSSLTSLTLSTSNSFLKFSESAPSKSLIATASPGNLEVFIIGGGGGGAGSGGYTQGGGGGAGGVILRKISIKSGSTLTITLGAGGATGTSYYGVSGTSTTITELGLTAYGGGKGGERYDLALIGFPQDGASGGGAPGYWGARAGAKAIYGDQGRDGGPNTGGGTRPGGGGGGGAKAVGGTGGDWAAGAGGSGVKWPSSGSMSRYWAGGGGGGCEWWNSGPGGAGGGGGGGHSPNVSWGHGGPGETNTGSGGGGSSQGSYGGNGGSGCVLVRYKGTTTKGTGGTITNDGKYTYHKFISSGVFTWL